MKKFNLFFLLLIMSSPLFGTVPPKEALERLVAGNKRFMEGKANCDNRRFFTNDKLLESQRPFAIILSCSDSRVPSEILFDQGIGDLFVVRVAGNLLGFLELESIEFAVENFKSSLILVMGHENCGAVKAVLDGDTKGVEWIPFLLQPAIKESATQGPNRLQNAIIDNVKFTVNALQNSNALSKYLKEGKLEVVGAYYHLQNGKVELLNESNKSEN